MGKIYYGEPGCGKTTRLLRQAEALVDDGLKPVFISITKEANQGLKYIADREHIDTSNFTFLSAAEFKDKRDAIVSDPSVRIMIDEVVVFVQDILGLRFKNGPGFYGTVGLDGYTEIKRPNEAQIETKPTFEE